MRRGAFQDQVPEKQGLDAVPADPVSENIEPLALAGEKEKAESSQDRATFEPPKKEVSRKNESEVQEKALEKSKAHKTVSAPEEKDVIANEKTDDDSRASGRKSKRNKHDIDEEEKQKKRSRQGSRKRRVEELISEDLLGEDLADEQTQQSDEPVEAVTLGLATPRAKRRSGSRILVLLTRSSTR